MNERIQNLIMWCQSNQQSVSDPFMRFFLYYVCFDAWVSFQSNGEYFEEKLRWLLKNPNCLRDNWEKIKPLIKQPIDGLKELESIGDERPGHNNGYQLQDVDKFESMIRTLHRIRCNLFHGSKSPGNSRDIKFVSNGIGVFKILIPQLIQIN